MNDDVGFYCKSFAPDFIHLSYLLKTFKQHNPDNLMLTLSLPEKDMLAFRTEFGHDIQHLKIVSDESYCGHDLTRYRGWHGQQICKLMSWQVMTAEHYAVLDSDCYFIGDVSAADIRPRNGARFVACGSSLRTVIMQGNDALIGYIKGECLANSSWFPQQPIDVLDGLGDFIHFKNLNLDNPSAGERSDIPFKAFGSKRWLFYQPGQFFSKVLLQRMCGLFDEHKITAGDAILICPWEYNWYGEFAATHGFNETQFRVSPFLHFQDDAGLAYARQCGFTEVVLSSKFPILQMAARHLTAFTM